MGLNLESKISTINLDNCSTNDSMIDKVKPKLLSTFLIKEGAMLHMRCAAHILNLIVRDGLMVIKDGILKIRESVAFWLATPRRVEKFTETSKQLRIVSVKRLVLDCPTRWNSTHKMLETAIPNMLVFKRLAQREPTYTCLPDDSQWEFAAIVCEKLAFFTPITELFSGSNYPTSNLFFSEVCDLKLKLFEWMKDPNPVISSMATEMDLKFQKYWDDIHDLLTVAVVLDPRFKLELVEYYAEKFGSAEPNLHSASVKSVLFDLVREYQSLNRILTTSQTDSVTSSVASSQNGSSSKSSYADFELYVNQRKKSKVCMIQSELDHYLSDDIVPNSEDFDILLWWRINSPKYPTLGDIARDFLAVPITSVASESAFSSGGRLLDPHRSRLHHRTVEALMCTRTWLQDDLRKDTNTEARQLEGLFTLLEVNDVAAEEEAELEGNLYVHFVSHEMNLKVLTF